MVTAACAVTSQSTANRFRRAKVRLLVKPSGVKGRKGGTEGLDGGTYFFKVERTKQRSGTRRPRVTELTYETRIPGAFGYFLPDQVQGATWGFRFGEGRAQAERLKSGQALK